MKETKIMVPEFEMIQYSLSRLEVACRARFENWEEVRAVLLPSPTSFSGFYVVEGLLTSPQRLVPHVSVFLLNQASLAGVMGNVSGVMKKVNDSVSTEETAKIMQQFAVENEKMNMSEEMMDDALIDAVRQADLQCSCFVVVVAVFDDDVVTHLSEGVPSAVDYSVAIPLDVLFSTLPSTPRHAAGSALFLVPLAYSGGFRQPAHQWGSCVQETATESLSIILDPHPLRSVLDLIENVSRIFIPVVLRRELALDDSSDIWDPLRPEKIRAMNRRKTHPYFCVHSLRCPRCCSQPTPPDLTHPAPHIPIPSTPTSSLHCLFVLTDTTRATIHLSFSHGFSGDPSASELHGSRPHSRSSLRDCSTR